MPDKKSRVSILRNNVATDVYHYSSSHCGTALNPKCHLWLLEYHSFTCGCPNSLMLWPNGGRWRNFYTWTSQPERAMCNSENKVLTLQKVRKTTYVLSSLTLKRLGANPLGQTSAPKRRRPYHMDVTCSNRFLVPKAPQLENRIIQRVSSVLCPRVFPPPIISRSDVFKCFPSETARGWKTFLLT